MEMAWQLSFDEATIDAPSISIPTYRRLTTPRAAPRAPAGALHPIAHIDFGMKSGGGEI
jgi:hypothetical protein